MCYSIKTKKIYMHLSIFLQDSLSDHQTSNIPKRLFKAYKTVRHCDFTAYQVINFYFGLTSAYPHAQVKQIYSLTIP